MPNPAPQSKNLLSFLEDQNPPVAVLAAMLQKNGNADLDAWMQAARSEDRDALQLSAQITNCLKVLQAQLTVMLANPEQKEHALQLILDFVNALADISPQFKQEIGELYAAKTSDIKLDADKIQRLQQIINYVLQTQNLNQLNLEVAKYSQAALLEADEALVKYVKGLKQAKEPKRDHALKAAQDEFAATTKSAIESADSNAPFDKLRKIGWMWATLNNLLKVAAYEAKHCQHNFVHAAPTNNAFLDNQRLKHRGVPTDVISAGAAPAPAAPAPTPMKI